MTKNYVIIIEQSLLVNGFLLGLCTPKKKSLEECLEWCPNYPTHFHVYDKRTNSLVKQKFESKGFFFFHSINAYESGNEIVLDILKYEDPTLLKALNIKSLRSGEFNTKSKSKFTRYVLPIFDTKEMKKNENLVKLADSKATAVLNEKGVIVLTGTSFGEEGFEMPTINSRRIGKDYTFIYGTGFLEKGFYQNAIAKLNIKDRKVELCDISATAYPSEVIFVPKPNSQDEDNGFLISLVLEADQDKLPYLIIVDARELKKLAKIEFDRNEISIPTTMHGVWLEREQRSQDIKPSSSSSSV
jgi:carotenoid cleavage dioxygenase-like enzyme